MEGWVGIQMDAWTDGNIYSNDSNDINNMYTNNLTKVSPSSQEDNDCNFYDIHDVDEEDEAEEENDMNMIIHLKHRYIINICLTVAMNTFEAENGPSSSKPLDKTEKLIWFNPITDIFYLSMPACFWIYSRITATL